MKLLKVFFRLSFVKSLVVRNAYIDIKKKCPEEILKWTWMDCIIKIFLVKLILTEDNKLLVEAIANYKYYLIKEESSGDTYMGNEADKSAKIYHVGLSQITEIFNRVTNLKKGNSKQDNNNFALSAKDCQDSMDQNEHHDQLIESALNMYYGGKYKNDKTASYCVEKQSDQSNVSTEKIIYSSGLYPKLT